jgi:hypothetical protein
MYELALQYLSTNSSILLCHRSYNTVLNRQSISAQSLYMICFFPQSHVRILLLSYICLSCDVKICISAP